jgi:inosose dehydratase
MLAAMTASLARAAGRLPANRNVRWALGSNLWNYFPRVPFTDILDVMRDTGFIGVRVTQFPQILTTYNMTAAELEREVSKRNLHVITISFNGPAHDPARRAEVLANAKRAMEFLKGFGANMLVVFSPSRAQGSGEAAFRSMCECYNQLGSVAGEMGFRAGLHNHMGQMVQTQEEVDRFMSMTDAKLFGLSPDTAHLHLAGCDVVGTINRYKQRIRFLDYKDAKWTTPTSDWVQPNGKVLAKDSSQGRFFPSIYDLGDGEVDFPGCHRVLKSVNYRGWVCVDLDTARKGPRADYERCGAYVVKKLQPIYL